MNNEKLICECRGEIDHRRKCEHIGGGLVQISLILFCRCGLSVKKSKTVIESQKDYYEFWDELESEAIAAFKLATRADRTEYIVSQFADFLANEIKKCEPQSVFDKNWFLCVLEKWEYMKVKNNYGT